jgi:hypothetical protein
MTTEFRRAHPRRTHIGDVFREPCTGILREVVTVWGASEYIEAKVDGRYYRYRHTSERSALVTIPGPRAEKSPANWRLT